jgi:hypothetical protein
MFTINVFVKHVTILYKFSGMFFSVPKPPIILYGKALCSVFAIPKFYIVRCCKSELKGQIKLLLCKESEKIKKKVQIGA